MGGWVFVAVALSMVLFSLRNWERTWSSPMSDPFWQGRNGRKFFSDTFVWRARRTTIASDLIILTLGASAAPTGLGTLLAILFFFVEIPLLLLTGYLGRPRFLVPPAVRDPSSRPGASAQERRDA